MRIFKTIGKVLLVIVGILAAYALFIIVYLSLRYSPEYMNREIFHNLDTVYSYRYFPERKLTASPEPFSFAADTSQEPLVKEAFQTGSKINDVDAFLEKTDTQAFLVIQDDNLIYERYFKGQQRDSIVTSFSVAKSFTSALIGIAIKEGYIKSVDDPITDYIPELAERDQRFQVIRIRDLLMMASGLRFTEEGGLPSTTDSSLTYSFDDLRKVALTETKIVEPPGKTFLYNDYNLILLGIILERATGKPVTTYLQEKIWSPIGMEYDGSWTLDSTVKGFEKMSAGINARAIDFAKFGRLYLNNGSWNGSQIVPADWVEGSTRDNGLIPDTNPVYYGYLWWGERCNPDSRDFFAWGNHGQFVYVSPAKKLIVVRNGEEYGLEGEGTEWGGIFCQFAKAMPDPGATD
jgi:CubicO group peptidase (beta-lactamase class C family)